MITETKKRRKRYDETFKRNAVKALIDSGKPVTTVALQLGIEQSNLHKWNKRYCTEFTIHKESGVSPADRDQEILELKKEIEGIKCTLETMRSIILKTMGGKYL